MSSNARITQQYVEAAGTPDSRNARITQQYVEAAVQLLPAVTTVGVDNSGSTAILLGSWSKATGSTIISELDAYFQYRETGAGSWSQTTTQEDIAEGSFYAELTGLTEGTEYEYRAVITFDEEAVYGDTESFTAKIVFESGFGSGESTALYFAIDASGLSLKTPTPLVTTIGTVTTPTQSANRSYGYRFRPAENISVGQLGVYAQYAQDYTICLWKNSDSSLLGTVTITGVVDEWAYVKLSSFVQLEAGADYTLTYNHPTSGGTTYRYGTISGGTSLAVAISHQTARFATAHSTYPTSSFTPSDALPGICGATYFKSDENPAERTKPHALSGTFPANTVSWTATTPTGTSVTAHAQVQETSTVTDEAVGTGDGVETEFYLDHWPTGAPTVKVDAVEETGFVQDLLDPRKITFDTAPADTLAITASYTAVDDPVELDWEAQTSGNALTVPTQGTNVEGKHLWIKQTLATTDPEVTPTLTLFEVAEDSEPDTALSVNVVTSVSVTEETSFSWSDQEVSIFDTCSVEEWLALEVSEPAAVPAVSISSAEEVGVAEWIGVLLSDLAVSVGEDISVSEDVGVLAEEAAGLEVSVYEECSVLESSTVGVSVITAFRYWRIEVYGTNNVYYTEGDFSTTGLALSNVEFRESKGGSDVTSGGTASCHESWNTTPPDAFDGDTDTRFSCSSSNGAWLRYDFGAGNEKEIVEVVLFPGKNSNDEWRCPKCFALAYYDGSAWVRKYFWIDASGWVQGTGKTFNDGSTEYVSFASNTGRERRYWRIWVQNNLSGGVECAEVELRDEASGTNLLGSGTVSAPSEDATHVVANIVDEDASTYWIPNGYEFRQPGDIIWFQYDFGSGSNQDVREFTFQARATHSPRGMGKSYIVLCSNNGSSWEVAWSNFDTTQESWSDGQIRTYTDPVEPDLTNRNVSIYESCAVADVVSMFVSAEEGPGATFYPVVHEEVSIFETVALFFPELVISAATEVNLTETLLLDSDYFVAVDTTVSVSEFTTVEGGHVLCSVVDTVSVTEAPWPAVSDLLAVVSEDVVLSEEVGTDRFALFFSLNEGVSVEEDVSLVVFPADALVEVSDDCGLSEDVELSLVSLIDVAVSEAVGVAEGVEGVVPFLPLSVQDGTFIQEGVGSESNLLGVAFDSVTVAEDILVVTDSCRVEVSEVVVCAEGDGVVLSSSQIELFEGVGLAEVVVVEVQEAEARLITCWEDVAVTEDVGLGGSELNAFALTDVIVREYAYPYWVIAHGQLLMFAEPGIPEVLIVTSVIDIEIDCLIPEIEVEVA